MMQKLIKWMNEHFAPVVTKITQNPWIASIQDTMMSIIPMIFVGSLVTMLSLVREVIPGFPDFWLLNAFSFGLISLFVAFLIPYYIMIKKDHDNMKLIAGFTSLALFLLLLNPGFLEDGSITFVFERFGGAGMFVAIIGGLFTATVMNLFGKMSFFKGDSVMPDFIQEWFDSLLPITAVLLTGFIFTSALNINLYDAIISVFNPLAVLGHSFLGFVLLYFLSVFLYSFGISPWVTMPIVYPIWLQGIADNSALVAQGLAPTYINTMETIFSGFIAFGGMGSTLVLVILMIKSKSTRLKSVGKAVIVPSIFNINEPVVYGASIAWNPILMIPFWLNGLLLPAITYIVLNAGMVTIPSKVFQLWYMPFPISTYMITSDFKALILLAVNVAVSLLIWYPFFKVYESQEVLKEQETQEDDFELELDLS